VTFTWVDFGVVLTGREILHFLDVVVITDEPLNKGKYCFLMLRDLATLSGFSILFLFQLGVIQLNYSTKLITEF
jgi:hypothetical protein